MNKCLLFTVGAVLLLSAPAAAVRPAAAPPGNYLYTAYRSSGFRLTVDGVNTWREDRKTRVLAQAAALPDSLKTQLAARADKWMDYTWPALPARIYLEYKHSGNRSDYEDRMTERRKALSDLVIAEVVTHDLKYLPKIADGLWATLEESTWVLPAHVGAQRIGTDLPDPSEPIVDLFDGETASSVAATAWLLRNELDRYSPVLEMRVRYELRKRVVDPYLQRDDFWWMGFGNRAVNNWNPWINSNVLAAALLTGTNADTLNLVLGKVLRSADAFINGYGDDGGCEEGPSYWSEAGGKLVWILELAKNVSGGRLDFSGVPLLHHIGAYIYKTHIAGEYFVNFADATAKTIPNPSSVFAFGRYFGDDTLKRFGAYLWGLQKGGSSYTNVNDFALGMESYRQLSTLSPLSPEPAVEWMPQVEVLTARPGKGLFLAAQGGNNGESHNHNDVGNFILYVKGIPVIVDAGVGTYTAQTFSSRRYELWNMQSQWHNCPLINGVQQKDGAQYKAGELSFTAGSAAGGKETILGMNIAGAYPPDAAVSNWKRTFSFRPGAGEVNLTDAYTLQTRKDTTRLNFMTACAVTQPMPGELLFTREGRGLLRMTFDPKVFTVQTQVKEMDDARLRSSWGQSLTRVSLAVKANALAGQTHIRFSTAD